MKPLIIILALTLTACAAGDGNDGFGPRLKPQASPSDIIAAELAFARIAREKGQWTAFRETAAEGAQMFTPQPVLAQQWLKGRADPPVAVAWQPHEVWASADGSLAVSYGAWQRPAATGFFVTAWRRQKNGRYKWVLDQGGALPQPLPAPEMIQAHVADKPQRGAATIEPCGSHDGNPVVSIISDDQTLEICTIIMPDTARQIGVFMHKGTDRPTVLNLRAAPES